MRGEIHLRIGTRFLPHAVISTLQIVVKWDRAGSVSDGHSVYQTWWLIIRYGSCVCYEVLGAAASHLEHVCMVSVEICVRRVSHADIKMSRPLASSNDPET